MSGIDFMALANGMMQGDRLNKEDDTYWRKQDKEDRDQQYQERDQAFKEQQQGYTLSDWQDQRGIKDAQRMAATAYDTYAKAAAAQGIPISQVIMNSPAFNLEGASPDMQAQFSRHLNANIALNVTGNLRKQGKYAEADALEAKLGQPMQGGENPMAYIGDPAKMNEFIARKFPGVQQDTEGNYLVAGQKRTGAEMMALATRSASSGAADLATYGSNDAIRTSQAATQTAVGDKDALPRDIKMRQYIRTVINTGGNEHDLPPEWRGMYQDMKGAKAASSGSAAPVDPLTAMTTQPAMPVTPGWVAEQRNAIPAKPQVAVPASVQAAAPMPQQASTAAPMDSGSGQAPTGNPLVEYKSSYAKLEKARALQEDAQRDIRLLEKAKAQGHFDPETMARAKAKLEEYTAAYQQIGLAHNTAAENWRKRVQDEENQYNSANAPAVQSAPRPSYVQALANKYR
jgi:hypothetical protein